MHRTFIMMCFALGMAALIGCQPTAPASPPQLSIIPFPTVTPGSMLSGTLPTPSQGRVGLSPAALAPSMPTALPETCPDVSDEADFPEQPANPADAPDAIRDYLNAGGDLNALEALLDDVWGILREDGFVRTDIDLTQGGQPEVIIGYADEASARFIIFGCDETGRFVERHRRESDSRPPDADFPDAPQILIITDMNLNNLPDLAVAMPECEGARCEYRTQVIEWLAAERRFVGLISGGGVLSGNLPEIGDIDDDQILEIVVRHTALGDINTGPLRTGVAIYDWNGTEYVLSIVQPEPLRYQIQVIHEADRNLAARRIDDAIRLYQRALTEDDLRIWLRNEEDNLETYALYRLLIAQAVQNQPSLELILERLLETFPEEEGTERPVYVALARVFWNAFTATGSVSLACDNVVRAVNEQYSEAVSFLNRYGSRNPTYTPRDLCPF